MEQQMDTLKVYKHYQHARLQKEGDDLWISSEDLRTEGSSDEDTQHKSRRNRRNKKQRKSDLPLPSPLPKSPDFDQLLTRASARFPDEKPFTPFDVHLEKRDIDFNVERCSIAEDSFSSDLYTEPGPSTSALSLGSTDADMDALNLESRWRPKRGSLKYPMLVEGTSVEV